MDYIEYKETIAENNKKIDSDDIYDILKLSPIVTDSQQNESQDDLSNIGLKTLMPPDSVVNYNWFIKRFIYQTMVEKVMNPNQISIDGGILKFIEKYRDFIYIHQRGESVRFNRLNRIDVDKVCEKCLSIIADVCIKRINSDIERELEIIKKIGFNRVAVIKEDTAALEDVLCVAYRAFELIDRLALHPKYKQDVYIPTRETLIEVCILYGVDKKVKTQKNVETVINIGKGVSEEMFGCIAQLVIGGIVFALIMALIRFLANL